MAIREVREGDVLLAKYIPAEDWKRGQTFFTHDADFIQVGSWNYGSGKDFPPHVHNPVERLAPRTQEVVYVRKGRVLAKVYSRSGRLVEQITLSEGDTIIMLDGGHAYRTLEEGTEALEVKNGPYLGPDVDRTRLQPVE